MYVHGTHNNIQYSIFEYTCIYWLIATSKNLFLKSLVSFIYKVIFILSVIFREPSFMQSFAELMHDVMPQASSTSKQPEHERVDWVSFQQTDLNGDFIEDSTINSFCL